MVVGLGGAPATDLQQLLHVAPSIRHQPALQAGQRLCAQPLQGGRWEEVVEGRSGGRHANKGGGVLAPTPRVPGKGAGDAQGPCLVTATGQQQSVGCSHAASQSPAASAAGAAA
jgi:hypothetical protein